MLISSSANATTKSGTEAEARGFEHTAHTRRRARLVTIVAIALLIRLIAMTMVQRGPLGPESELWKSGLEIVNIAAAMASHQGFSSPFGVPTGPTGWIPPVYPSIVCLIFLIAGIKTSAAAFMILTMQSIFSAMTCFPLYGVGRRIFGHQVGILAAWVWALFPYTVLMPILFIWETSLSALLLAVLCYFSLRLSSIGTISQIGVGILWGVAALTNTALLSTLSVFCCWPLLDGCKIRPSLRIWIVVSLSCFLGLSPWLWRNWHSLHAAVPIRSNFGEELWIGNHAGGTGRTFFGVNPPENDRELKKYATLGEIKFVAGKQREALGFIRAHPGRFLSWTAYRAAYWWYANGESAPVFIFYRALSLISIAGIGLSLFKKNRSAILLAAAVFLFPIIYYITDVYVRYRHPIEPLMILLGTFFLIECLDLLRNPFRARTGFGSELR